MVDKKDFMLSGDMLLDDVSDLPSFKLWPEGLYLIALNEGITEDTINDIPFFRAAFTLVEIRGIIDETAVPPAIGDEHGMIFNRTNEFGAGNWKKLAKPISEITGEKTVDGINQNSKGVQLLVLLGTRPDKDDKTKIYQQLVEASAP